MHRLSLETRAASLDREARTVEAVASTGADVLRPGFTERLAMTPEAVDLTRLNGAPVLDAHRQGSTRDILGRVEAAELREGALIVRLRIVPGADGDRTLDLIAGGFLTGISVGYSVDAFTDQTRTDGGVLRNVSRWTPMEVSLVPVPADPGATIRSQQENPMSDVQTPSAAAQSRATVHQEIRSIAAVTGLDQAWIDAQIDNEATTDAARKAAFEALSARSANAPRASVGFSHDAPAVRAERMGEALYARAHPDHELSGPARAFAGLSIPEMARDCLRHAGVSVTGLSPEALVTRAHSTSDFPAIFGDAVGRTVRRAYENAPSSIRNVARQTTARDFRTKHRIQVGEAPALEKVVEGGEYTYGTIAEAQETYRLETFGKIIAITRQMQVNDDLGAFSDIARRMGIAARAFEDATLSSLLEANPALSDGDPLFHANHKNLLTGTAITVGNLSSARTAMRKQTGLSGALISIRPRTLLVPPELETLAEQHLAELAPTKASDVNPFGRLELVVESRLADPKAWYLVADPAVVDGLEYAYLEGAPGPQILTDEGFDVDAFKVKVRLDFGAGFVEHRSWQKNPGA